ncbi:MAG: glycosyltransferase family 39 protein [Bacteroidales bacterium]
MLKDYIFKSKNNVYLLAFSGIILLFVLFKIPYLSLPFYWDEAWSYAMAVFDMAQNGPTLLPGHANEWFTRGHPLMYYFLSSSWLKVFGLNLLSAHAFALLISVLSLIIIFYVFKHLVNQASAFIISLAVGVQSMFLSQSTMLLPEIFLMLLSVLVFYGYVTKKWYIYIVFSSLLVLSKETGLILILVILFDKIFLSKLFYWSDIEKNKQFVKEIIILSIPVIVFVTFLLIQKKNLGYFLYPEHIGMTNFEFRSIKANFINYSLQLIWNNLRQIWLFIAIISLVIGLVFGKKISKQQVHLLVLSIIFIIGYLLFSSVNFFTTRYLLTLLPFYFFIVVSLINYAVDTKIPIVIVLCTLLVANFIDSYAKDGEGDCVLTFRETVICHRNAINYCENKGYYNKYINTGFLMSFNLKYPHLGYLQGEKRFVNVNKSESPEVYIFYSNEPDSNYEKVKSDTTYFLEKRFSIKNAWVEIYTKKNI